MVQPWKYNWSMCWINLQTMKAVSTVAESVTFVPIVMRIDEPVLCMAVDVAWWGGRRGAGHRQTRTETIASASLAQGEWSDLSLTRVDLNETYNSHADHLTPNADPDASTLAAAIKRIIDDSGLSRVVLAVDMPILAMPRDGLIPQKTYERGEGGKYRQCDEEWMKRREILMGWRSVNIFPVPRFTHE